MKIYLTADYKTRQVWLNDKLLNPIRSQKIINHSPDGFAWGYGGSGPAQLALAICLEIFPEDFARLYYQNFKWLYIASLPDKDLIDQKIEIDKKKIKNP